MENSSARLYKKLGFRELVKNSYGSLFSWDENNPELLPFDLSDLEKVSLEELEDYLDASASKLSLSLGFYTAAKANLELGNLEKAKVYIERAYLADRHSLGVLKLLQNILRFSGCPQLPEPEGMDVFANNGFLLSPLISGALREVRRSYCATATY